MNAHAARVLIVFLLPAEVSSAFAQAGPPAPLPMPGRLVDVGGWKLHLNCTGNAVAGQPTVVLEAGAGDISVEWSLVQPDIAKFARVCSYDRAGSGWSELGPYPRTFHQIAYELHTLLANAGEQKPYVLVAHSFGGWPVRTFQIAYPNDVAGMVLVEAGHDDPLRMLGDGKVVHASELVRGTPIPPVKTSGPLQVTDIPPEALGAIRAGMVDATRRALEPPRDRLPADAQKMRVWSFSQIGIYVNGNPAEIEELAWLREQRNKSEHPLGNLPLIVFTRGKPEEEGPDSKNIEADRYDQHESLSKMSTRGRHIVAAGSGHHVQIEEPYLVVAAVREMLAASLK